MMIETKIMNLSAPFDYIYCNGELGKHIGTLIVTKATWNEEGEYELETHSHPIVQYWNSPKGTVWNQAELRDCEVLCNDDDKRVDVDTFGLLCYQRYNQLTNEAEETQTETLADSTSDVAISLKEGLRHYSIGFRNDDNEKPFELCVEVNKCHEGYYALTMDPGAIFFNITEETMDQLAASLKEEREYWEDFFDHTIRIKYSPESSLAIGFVENI
ncbi:hypothetical protein [Xylanibacter ruminicola]|nr:hypothetical protein [Xylanibacter ruminicola]